MKNLVKSHLFLLKKDFFIALSQNKRAIASSAVVLALGVAFGVYIGVKVGGKPTPFGVFSSLFYLEFKPFSYIVPDFLRFLLLLGVTVLAFFMPLPALYPAVALFFFGKYFGEIACVCFLSDPVFSAVISIILIYLPLLVVGWGLILSLSLRAKAFLLCSGVDPCRSSAKSRLFLFVWHFSAYFLTLFFLYVVLCGVLYLVVIAI